MDNNTPPTCTTAGVETGMCTRDAATAAREVIDPTAHDWETVPSTATVTANGIEGRVCNNNHAHDETTITYATGTAGLEFALINSNTAYRVHNGGDRTFTAVHIPAFHRADADSPYLPVTEIGNGTNAIANNAFGGTSSSPNTTLTTVTFAEGSPLTTISNYAFAYSSNLDGITIPASVTTISYQMFYKLHQPCQRNPTKQRNDYRFVSVPRLYQPYQHNHTKQCNAYRFVSVQRLHQPCQRYI